MATFNLKAWTGPTLAKEISDKLRSVGHVDAWAGTEHVYVVGEDETLEGAAHNMCADLMKRYNTDFHLQFKTF